MKHETIPVRLGGIVAEAQRRSEEYRLRDFVVDIESEALALFTEAHKSTCRTGDWYGEHVGKWLVTAARCAKRTENPDWISRIGVVLDVLEKEQEPSGYLGTYAPDARCRFDHPEVSHERTWDLWVHAWMMLGLIECSTLPESDPRALSMAVKIGELILSTFAADPGGIVRQGNHAGLSSLVVLEPLALLSRATRDPRFALFGQAILQIADRQGLPLLADPPVPISQVGTGKIYQLIWCLQGILELGRETKDPQLIERVEHYWHSIRDHHLTPFGGPWGGIATHKEVFNPPGFFDPCGLVETCSSATWLTLTQELFLLTGDLGYLAEVERTLMNAILGAQDENGRDWCYFTIPNGRRNNTYHWACCKSSGALALESCSGTVLTQSGDDLWINQWMPFEAILPDGTQIWLETEAERLRLVATKAVQVRMRVPAWAETTLPSEKGVITIVTGPEGVEIPYRRSASVVPFTYSLDHHGQEIVREDYACIVQGPFVFATGKLDGFASEFTVRLPQLNPNSVLDVVDSETIVLRQAGCKPIRFEPFYRAGGRSDGAWRTTWMRVAWQ